MEIVQYVLSWIDAHFWRLVFGYILIVIITTLTETFAAKFISKDWEP